MLSLYDFYMTEVQSQFPATQAMIEGGLHIDVAALIETRKRLRLEVESHESNLTKLAGWTPNTKSNQEMEKLLLQFGVTPNRTKPSRNFPRGQARVAKEDLLGYSHKFPSVRPILDVCLEITQRRTLQSSFLGMALDTSDYYHPTYRLNGTKSGRFASEGAAAASPQRHHRPPYLPNLANTGKPDTHE